MLFENSFLFPLYERDGKHVKNCRICPHELLFHELNVPIPDVDISCPELFIHSCRCLDFRKIIDHGFGKRGGRKRTVKMIRSDVESQGDSVYLTGVFMEAVIVQFTLNEKEDQDTAGNSDGETNNIDEGIPPVFLDNPQYDCHVVL